MNIVSLQSIGLGSSFTGRNNIEYYTPYVVSVGRNLFTSDGFRSSVTVDKIVGGDKSYLVYTSDGHMRKFPIDSYIAEYA